MFYSRLILLVMSGLLLILSITACGNTQSSMATTTSVPIDSNQTTNTFTTTQLTLLAFESVPNMSANLPNGGLGVEIVRASFQEVGIEVKIEFLPLKRVVTYMQENAAMGMLGNLKLFPEEDTPHLNLIPNLIVRYVFFYYKPNYPNGLSYETLADLQPYKVGCLLGSAVEKKLKAANLTVEASTPYNGLFKKLTLKRIDLVAALDISGEQAIKELFPDETENFAQIDKPIMETPAGIIFNQRYPNTPYFEAKYKEGFAMIQKNGKYLEILEKYYGQGKVPPAIQKLTIEQVK